MGPPYPPAGPRGRRRLASLTRLVDGGLLERVAHGIYRVRGTPEADHLDLRAAWLQLDPGRPAWQRLDDPEVAVVSHTSAASLYGVGDLRADVHEFTIPDRRQTRRPDVRLHRGRVPPSRGSSWAAYRRRGRAG